MRRTQSRRSSGRAARDRQLTMTALQELEEVIARYDHGFDEPESITFLARVREEGILKDHDWQQILDWLDDEVSSPPIPLVEGEPLHDLDVRGSDWLRIVGAMELIGYRVPSWATLWLWWVNLNRDDEVFWGRIGSVAEEMGFQELKLVKDDE